MSKIGNEALILISKIDDTWKKLQKKSGNLNRINYLYGKFQYEIVQDKNFGEQILKTILENTAANSLFDSEQSIISLSDAENISSPIVIMSSEQGKIGQIIEINNSACALFGNQRHQLLHRKINTLMPDMYSIHHDEILNRHTEKA